MFRTFLLCAVLALAGCGGDSSGDASGDPAKVTYADSLSVNLSSMNKSDSGLYLLDQQVGDGAEAVVGKRVKVHYTGWLPNGSVFDTSRARDQPFTFALGAGQVIKGWDEGVVGMKVGGKRRLILPSELGYGSNGSPPVIPGDSVLIFDVEVLGVY